MNYPPILYDINKYILLLEVVIMLRMSKTRKSNSNKGAILDRMIRVEACCGSDNESRTWFKLQGKLC